MMFECGDPGIGTFYNCNFSKDKYRRCGIGTIEHTDTEKIGNLLYAIGVGAI